MRGDGQRKPAPSVEVESARLGYQFNTIGVIPRQSKTGASPQMRKVDRVPPQRTDTRRPDVMTLTRGVRAGDRTVLARAITLVESKLAGRTETPAG